MEEDKGGVDMKATELMIGDWIYDSENGRCFQSEKCLFEYCDDWDRIHPIPLTAEILEKNGLKKRGCEFVVFGYERAEQWNVTLEDFKPQFDFWFIESFGRDFNVRGKIRYVHELQHALRLCGLNDLADNFQV